ncbi:MAG TPA: adenosylmethionine--8-amino-7-oxononanoate transaminase [Planctomycetaceae bacterium]|nr:adenosylmethionine--8-amino-7-oxononanoate transaminase [Planctomycetaceae bacterium]
MNRPLNSPREDRCSPSATTLTDWDRHHLWHAFTQMAEYEPLIIERAEGCLLYDMEGNSYLDGVSSLWCNVHGHRHPHLDQAIIDQLADVAHVTSLGMSNPTSIRLAAKLAELAPGQLNHVFFSSDGSSAVEVAVKMAFQYWQQRADAKPAKQHFVTFTDSYHGDTLGSVSVGGIARYQAIFQPLLFQTFRLPIPDTYRIPAEVAVADVCEHHLRHLKALLSEHHEKIAAVIIEPLIQGAAGIVLHPDHYLSGVRELTRRYDVLLIADEVAVGFGRTGTLFACQQESVTPDLLCLGKGLTGGYLPMSATLATDDIWNAFLGEYGESKTFYHGHTYGGNPLAAAVALATLELFEQQQTLQQLPEKSEHLGSLLNSLRSLPHVGDVRHKGLIGAVELVRDPETKEPFPWEEQRGAEVCRIALQHGVWLRPLGNVIVIMPPLSVTLSELDQILEAIRLGITAMAETTADQVATTSDQSNP